MSDSLWPMDCSPAGSSVHGILQARILEWVAISFSRGFSQHRDRAWVSCIASRFFTVWAITEAPAIISTLKYVQLAFTVIFTMCKIVTINTQIVNNSSALIRSVFLSAITPPVWKTSYNIFGNASLLVMNSFSFCVSLRSSQYSLLWKGVFC